MTDLDTDRIERIVESGDVAAIGEATRMELWVALARTLGTDPDLDRLDGKDRIPKADLMTAVQRSRIFADPPESEGGDDG